MIVRETIGEVHCMEMKPPMGGGRKRYVPPRVTRYGDLRRITLTKGGGANDGGAPKPNTKDQGAST